MTSGRQPTGPSETYRKLLAGEVTSEEYVAGVKAEVNARMRRDYPALYREPRPSLLRRLARWLNQPRDRTPW